MNKNNSAIITMALFILCVISSFVAILISQETNEEYLKTIAIKNQIIKRQKEEYNFLVKEHVQLIRKIYATPKTIELNKALDKMLMLNDIKEPKK